MSHSTPTPDRQRENGKREKKTKWKKGEKANTTMWSNISIGFSIVTRRPYQRGVHASKALIQTISIRIETSQKNRMRELENFTTFFFFVCSKFCLCCWIGVRVRDRERDRARAEEGILLRKIQNIEFRTLFIFRSVYKRIYLDASTVAPRSSK